MFLGKFPKEVLYTQTFADFLGRNPVRIFRRSPRVKTGEIDGKIYGMASGKMFRVIPVKITGSSSSVGVLIQSGETPR